MKSRNVNVEEKIENLKQSLLALIVLCVFLIAVLAFVCVRLQERNALVKQYESNYTDMVELNDMNCGVIRQLDSIIDTHYLIRRDDYKVLDHIRMDTSRVVEGGEYE